MRSQKSTKNVKKMTHNRNYLFFLFFLFLYILPPITCLFSIVYSTLTQIKRWFQGINPEKIVLNSCLVSICIVISYSSISMWLQYTERNFLPEEQSIGGAHLLTH